MRNFIRKTVYLCKTAMCMHTNTLLSPSLGKQMQHVVRCSYKAMLVILHPNEDDKKLMMPTAVTVLHISVILHQWTADFAAE